MKKFNIRSILIGASIAIALSAAFSRPVFILSLLFDSRIKAAHSLNSVCQLYASEHNGHYPETSKELEAEWGHCLDPAWRPTPTIEYRLRQGITAESPDSTITIYSVTPVRYGKYYAVQKCGAGYLMNWEDIALQLHDAQSERERKSK